MSVLNKRKELVFREPTMAYGCVTDNGNYLLMLSFRSDHKVQTGVYLDGLTGRLIRPIYDVFKEFAYASNFKNEKIRKLSHEEFLEKYNALSFKERIFLHYNMFMLKLLNQKDGSFKLAIPSEKFIISYKPTEETIKYFIILYNRKQKYKRKQIAEGKYQENAWKSKEIKSRSNDNHHYNGNRSFESGHRNRLTSSFSNNKVNFVSSSSSDVSKEVVSSRPKRPRINRSV
jgi:hypothetical protein